MDTQRKMTTEQSKTTLDVTIVSDVMCPWCVIGYRQLEQAMIHTGIAAYSDILQRAATDAETA